MKDKLLPHLPTKTCYHSIEIVKQSFSNISLQLYYNTKVCLQCPLEVVCANVLKLLGKTGRNLAGWCLFCLAGNLIRQDIADALPVLPCVCIRTEIGRVAIEDINGPSTLGQVASCLNQSALYI